MLGIAYTSILFNNYLELTNAVGASARVLANSRGSGKAFLLTQQEFLSGVTNLTQSSPTLMYTFYVAGHPCVGDGSSSNSCDTLLAANLGGVASVKATYLCNMDFMGINFIPNCTLTSQTADPVQ